MNPLFVIASTIFAIVPLAVPAAFKEKKPTRIILKLGTLAPEGTTWVDSIKNIVYLAEETGSGEVKTQIYTGGVMGDEPDMVRKLRLGQLHMGVFTVHGMTAIAPEAAVLELPFLFDSSDEVDYIRGKFLPIFEKIFEKHGFILLAIAEQGFVHIYTNEPARTPEELSRQKMWVWADEPVAVQTFEAMDIKSIPLPVPEVLQGLRTGLINAIYTSPLVCLSFQWFTGIKYIIEINMRYEPGVVVITKKAWDTLSPSDQKVILNTVRQNIPGIIAQTRKDNKQSFEAILQSGVKLITLSPEEREVFRSRAMSVWDNLADNKYPRSLLEEIVKALKEFRQKRR